MPVRALRPIVSLVSQITAEAGQKQQMPVWALRAYVVGTPGVAHYGLMEMWSEIRRRHFVLGFVCADERVNGLALSAPFQTY